MAPATIPYAHFFPLKPFSIAILANGHILVVESLTGRIVHSTPGLNTLSGTISKSGLVVCSAISEDGRYLVTVTGDKVIRVWEICEESLTLLSERENPKKATDVKFADGHSRILVSDKFGDIHSYPLHHTPDSEKDDKETVARPATAKKTSNGKLLLGHVSHLSSFLLSYDGEYIITADRDEHIRVSWYPESHIIESFCLGQKKFVSALHIPRWAPDVLVSGGGDPVIKFWDWCRGKLLGEATVDVVVTPFIKVSREREGKGGDSDGEDGGPRLSSRKKRKEEKKKRKEQATEVTSSTNPSLEHDSRPADSESMDVDGLHAEDGDTGNDQGESSKSADGSSRPLLALRRISSITSPDKRLLLFSATGATALFYCDFPDLSVSYSAPYSGEISSLDFCRPVLDFAVDEGGNEILVLLDGAWSEDESESSTSQRICAVSFSNGKLNLSEGGAWQKLIETLNSYQYPGEDQTYDDLYSALIILPKHIEESPEENQNKNAEEASSENGSLKDRPLSQKELGRLKSKVARSRVISSLQSELKPESASVSDVLTTNTS